MRPRSEPASNKIWQEKIGFSGKAGLMAMNRAGGKLAAAPLVASVRAVV
jgi:hypothetical protein